MKKLDINDLVDFIFDEISNYAVFENWFELDDEIQEQCKTKLREAISEWSEEDENSTGDSD